MIKKRSLKKITDKMRKLVHVLSRLKEDGSLPQADLKPL
jgi:hypothetical protein